MSEDLTPDKIAFMERILLKRMGLPAPDEEDEDIDTITMGRLKSMEDKLKAIEAQRDIKLGSGKGHRAKERPIIMGAESVRAILEGRKTMTRRVIKPQPIWSEQYECWLWAGGSWPATESPYGQVGGRLWVKEKWAVQAWASDGGWGEVVYYDGEERIVEANFPFSKWYPAGKPICLWRSPIYMPRWASRITLEVTDSRVERLQDISEEDVWSEGIHYGSRRDYEQLWDDINARRGFRWESNPWVFVISFEKVTQ